MNKYKLRRIVSASALLIVATSCVAGAVSMSNNRKDSNKSVTTDCLQTTNTETTSVTEFTDTSTLHTTTECSSSTSDTTDTSTTYQYTTVHLAEPIPVTTKVCTTSKSTTTKPIEVQKPVAFESTSFEETTSACTNTSTNSSTTLTTTMTETTTSTSYTETKKPIISLSASEIKMLSALVTLEAGSEGYECQKGVASVVINRMLTSGSSLSSVIYAKGQFSVAGRVSSTKPFEISTKAVNDVVYNGTTLPIYVTYFRAGRYHTWGDQVAYTRMDHTYFSYSKALKNKYS